VERLAAALRENLKRRKSQARAQAAQAPEPAAEGQEDHPNRHDSEAGD
jgi:hypothetical protein